MDEFWDLCDSRDDREVLTREWFGWDKFRTLYAFISTIPDASCTEDLFYEFEDLTEDGYDVDSTAIVSLALTLLLLVF